MNNQNMNSDDIRLMFSKEIKIPAQVNKSMEMAYDTIRNTTDSKDMSEKGSKTFYISNKGRWRLATLLVACLLCFVGITFREQIIKAAHEGYNFIYGHGVVKVDEENCAYIYEDEVVLGKDGEMTIKYIYWYQDELAVFTSNSASETQNLSDTKGDLLNPIYINDNLSEDLSTEIVMNGSMAAYMLKTETKAKDTIKITAFGESVELKLEQQEIMEDQEALIIQQEKFGKVLLYPINSKGTAYFYEIKPEGIYEGMNSCTSDAVLYLDGKEISTRDYVSIHNFIVLDDKVATDGMKIGIQYTLYTMCFSPDDGTGISLPLLKDGETQDVHMDIPVNKNVITIENVRREGKKYIIKVKTDIENVESVSVGFSEKNNEDVHLFNDAFYEGNFDDSGMYVGEFTWEIGEAYETSLLKNVDVYISDIGINMGDVYIEMQ